MGDQTLLELIMQGWLTFIPLAIGSIFGVAVIFERFWRYSGVDKQTREITRQILDALSKRDLEAAEKICDGTKTPIGRVFKEALSWKDIALEDLDRVVATSRLEAMAELKRGLWILGTIGSLAPFIGLFGTVVGIMRAFAEIAVQKSGGFEVVASGISEALIATAAGLGVAIVALAFYNYLQVWVGSLGSTIGRGCERFLQALLYVGSAEPAESAK